MHKVDFISYKICEPWPKTAGAGLDIIEKKRNHNYYEPAEEN